MMIAFRNKKTGEYFMGHNRAGEIQFAKENMRLYKLEAFEGMVRRNGFLLIAFEAVFFNVEEVGTAEIQVTAAPVIKTKGTLAL